MTVMVILLSLCLEPSLTFSEVAGNDSDLACHHGGNVGTTALASASPGSQVVFQWAYVGYASLIYTSKQTHDSLLLSSGLEVPFFPSVARLLHFNRAYLDHQGPVSTYMTSCNGDCSTFSANPTRWFKVDADGYDPASRQWAAAKLIASQPDIILDR